MSSVHKYHKSCSQLIWPFYGLLELHAVNFKNLISPWVQSKSITNRVLSSYDRFKAYYNCMSLNFKNVISPWVQSTSITNRVLSPIDRFTACYNCMSKNFQNVISPGVECTDITNRVLKLIWPFYGLLQLYELKLQKCHISVSLV